MEKIYLLGLVGAGGALIYGVPVYLKDISREPPVVRAAWNLILAVFAGALCASVVTDFIGHHFPWAVTPKPYALALVLGIASNSLIPILLRKLVTAAEDYKIGVFKR